MNVSLDLGSANRPKPRSLSPTGCGLDCQEELFGHLADRSQLCILQSLCQGAKTDVQIATATGLSQRDISVNIERLLGCGCVKAEERDNMLLYGLSVPRLLQLEGIVDDMLIAALKGGAPLLNHDW
jgi:DNA-binding transcriptional ArsR family regulator